ncbi:hypothetical protein [Mycobacterium antarcticum]|uniref:hypothetical protein n=1 Tax=Mycolicibacterium sp. TUM20984 TaxID=3023368 RepID=UPI00239171BF|nr:hypothetical protein [Mycolicibacterium sp. TUM20984]GLP79560.1 hypothetical protein TUM20984_09800 [Mycolicibacterium sp. TUM20984]
MGRLVAAALLAGVAALGAAIPAGADPADLVPFCSGDQTPMDSNCREAPSQIFTREDSGLSPNLPMGIDPANEPVI